MERIEISLEKLQSILKPKTKYVVQKYVVRYIFDPNSRIYAVSSWEDGCLNYWMRFSPIRGMMRRPKKIFISSFENKKFFVHANSNPLTIDVENLNSGILFTICVVEPTPKCRPRKKSKVSA